MTDSVDELSQKVKDYLTKLLIESQKKIKKLNNGEDNSQIIKFTTAGTSITISVILASISALTLPPAVIPTLTICSGILTGLSAKFGFEDNAYKLKKEIENLNKIQVTLDYLISCNGSLTDEIYMQIVKEFSVL